MIKNQIIYESLPWDSNFFGYSTGKIVIKKFDKDCLVNIIKKANAELLYIFDGTLSGEVDKFLLSAGAVQYDCKMEYKKLLPRDCDCSLDQNIEFYDAKLTDELEQLAYSAGKYSRFRKDKKLQVFFEALYKRLILNSLEGGGRLLVIRKDNQIIGFLSFSVTGEKANISLFSVNRDELDKGFGTRLYHVLESFLVKSGVTELTIGTQQENVRACHFYEKLGFKLLKQQNIYHLWR